MLPGSPRCIARCLQPVGCLVLAITMPMCRGAEIQPGQIVLSGRGASQQLVIMGQGCELKSSDPLVVSIDKRRLVAIAGKAGEAEIRAKCGSSTTHARSKCGTRKARNWNRDFHPT